MLGHLPISKPRQLEVTGVSGRAAAVRIPRGLYALFVERGRNQRLLIGTFGNRGEAITARDLMTPREDSGINFVVYESGLYAVDRKPELSLLVA